MAIDFNRPLSAALLAIALCAAGCGRPEAPAPAQPAAGAPSTLQPIVIDEPAAPPAALRPEGAVRETVFADAKQRAAREGRDLLVLAHGSDWCPEGEEFLRTVWNAPGIAAGLEGAVVLTDIDRKQTPVDSAASQPKDKQKGFDYGVQTYPTVVVFDSSGRVAGAVSGVSLRGGMGGTVDALNDILRRRARRDALWAQAGKAAGTEKARLLGEGLDIMRQGAGYKNAYKPVIEAMKAADPDNATGYPARFAFDGYGTVNKARDMAEAKQYDDALKWLDGLLPTRGYTDEQKQWIHTARFIVFNQWTGHRDDAIAALKAVIALGADTDMATGARNYLNRLQSGKTE